MTDYFPNQSTYDGPATRSFVVTPDDDMDLTDTPREIYVGTQGDVAGVLLNDPEDASARLFVGLSGRIPYRFRRIYATNTTASDIVAVL